jgi:hypothetical protein
MKSVSKLYLLLQNTQLEWVQYEFVECFECSTQWNSWS